MLMAPLFKHAIVYKIYIFFFEWDVGVSLQKKKDIHTEF